MSYIHKSGIQKYRRIKKISDHKPFKVILIKDVLIRHLMQELSQLIMTDNKCIHKKYEVQILCRKALLES